jgi:hypothetical protein
MKQDIARVVMMQVEEKAKFLCDFYRSRPLVGMDAAMEQRFCPSLIAVFQVIDLLLSRTA